MGVALPGDAAHVWLDASHDDTVWSRLVLARADHVVLLAAAGDDPGLRPLERGLYSAALRFPQRVSLVLVHAPGTTLPSDTSRWLVPRRLVGHHHVRADPGDHHRAARLLCGRGLGLVLGGGGALGAAHVGLIAALLHRGVPIDFVGGTSAGGGIAAALAMVRDFESFHATIVEHFVGRNPMRHPTVPFISLLSREAVDETAQSMFGDATAEDLWVPWFCVSANLNTGRAKVHRRGPVWRAVRATSSIPVLLAPVVDNGEVLVDGSSTTCPSRPWPACAVAP